MKEMTKEGAEEEIKRLREKLAEAEQRALEGEAARVASSRALWRELERTRGTREFLAGLHENGTGRVQEFRRRVMGIGDGDGNYQAILGVAMLLNAEACAASLEPNLTDAQRHFNAGRLAGMTDLILAIEGVRQEGKGE